jgi:hypothetical protein
MAVTITHIEGFDDGNAVARRGGWSLVASGYGSPTVTSTGGRGNFGSAMRLTSGNFTGLNVGISIAYTISPIINTQFLVGVAWRPVTSVAQTNGEPAAIALVGTNSLCLTTSSGVVQLRQGVNANSALVASSVSAPIQVNTWHHVEINVLQGAANTGRVVVRVDGVEVIDTSCTVSGISSLRFGSEGLNGSPPRSNDFDDLFIGTCDASTEFLSDNRVYTLFPAGNGSLNQGLGSDGNTTDNHLLVDEATVSTADYVDISAGERDLYDMQALPFVNGTIEVVQPRGAMERTDVGSITAQSVIKQGANETLVAGTQPPYGSVGYIVYSPQATKPGGGAWTVADVNNAEFGIEGV